jgi:type IV pilus assembly protein PilW
MKAMYGKATTIGGPVAAYDKTAPTSNTDWQKVTSVRIAVVARSNQYEKDIVTAAVPQWDVGAAIAVASTATCNGTSKCLSLDVSTLPDWQHYRYKVYDTIVPLRNMIWNQ